jgi:hypothetical protein
MKSETITCDKIDLDTFDFPEPSGWVCYLWGNKPGGGGMAYYPAKGHVPNAFVRFMMKVCFACTWVYEGEK